MAVVVDDNDVGDLAVVVGDDVGGIPVVDGDLAVLLGGDLAVLLDGALAVLLGGDLAVLLDDVTGADLTVLGAAVGVTVPGGVDVDDDDFDVVVDEGLLEVRAAEVDVAAVLVVVAAVVDVELRVMVVVEVVVAVAAVMVVTFVVVVTGGLLVVVPAPGFPLFLVAAPATWVTLDASAGLTSLPGIVGSRLIGSAVLLSLVLCFVSLSLSFFRLGFFMFRTTLPVDFTGALFVFIGIVAILGFTNTSVSVNAIVAALTSTGLEEVTTVLVVVGFVSGVLCVVDSVAFSVVDCSQWLLHLHGLLFSIGNPETKNESLLESSAVHRTPLGVLSIGSFRFTL